MIKRWRYILDERKAYTPGSLEDFPNRRGSYAHSNYGVRKDQRRRRRKVLNREKWAVSVRPFGRHHFNLEARHNWAHAIGTRETRERRKRQEASREGFQLEVKREKPKVPGRVLRAGQEAQRWRDEAYSE